MSRWAKIIFMWEQEKHIIDEKMSFCLLYVKSERWKKNNLESINFLAYAHKISNYWCLYFYRQFLLNKISFKSFKKFFKLLSPLECEKLNKFARQILMFIYVYTPVDDIVAVVCWHFYYWKPIFDFILLLHLLSISGEKQFFSWAFQFTCLLKHRYSTSLNRFVNMIFPINFQGNLLRQVFKCWFQFYSLIYALIKKINWIISWCFVSSAECKV